MDKFWQKVSKTPDCWEWGGSKEDYFRKDSIAAISKYLLEH